MRLTAALQPAVSGGTEMNCARSSTYIKHPLLSGHIVNFTTESGKRLSRPITAADSREIKCKPHQGEREKGWLVTSLSLDSQLWKPQKTLLGWDNKAGHIFAYHRAGWSHAIKKASINLEEQTRPDAHWYRRTVLGAGTAGQKGQFHFTNLHAVQENPFQLLWLLLWS